MKKMSLSTKVFIGFIIGILLGIVFKDNILVIKPIGELFLTLIKMLVVPLVFFSIVSGVTSISDVQKLKRIGLKTVLYYLVTTMLAGMIGLLVAYIVKPGSNFDMAVIGSKESAPVSEMPTLGQTILGMFPSNPVKALADGNLMQIIVFAIFLGISIVLIGDKARRISQFMQESTEVMYKMTHIVMAFSPVGVAALIACTVGEYGLSIFGPLAKFILTDYLGLISVIIVLYLFMLKFIAKVPITYFFKNIGSIWLMTVSTTSSSGTLPVTISVAEKKYGIASELAKFVLPLGATMNMNGAVVYYSAAIIFVSQIYGVDLTIYQQIMIILLTTLISIGSPGIPGGGIVMTIMLLTTMGLPMEIVGLIAGIYRVIDMGHTTLNVTGDVVSALCIARSENLIDDNVYK